MSEVMNALERVLVIISSLFFLKNSASRLTKAEMSVRTIRI